MRYMSYPRDRFHVFYDHKPWNVINFDLFIFNCTIFNAMSCGISAMFDCLCHYGDAKMWFDC